MENEKGAEWHVMISEWLDAKPDMLDDRKLGLIKDKADEMVQAKMAEGFIVTSPFVVTMDHYNEEIRKRNTRFTGWISRVDQ